MNLLTGLLFKASLDYREEQDETTKNGFTSPLKISDRGLDSYKSVMTMRASGEAAFDQRPRITLKGNSNGYIKCKLYRSRQRTFRSTSDLDILVIWSFSNTKLTDHGLSLRRRSLSRSSQNQWNGIASRRWMPRYQIKLECV